MKRFFDWIFRSRKKVVRKKLLSIVRDIRKQMDEPLSRMSVMILKDSMDSLLNTLFEWDCCYYRNGVISL